MSADRIPRPRVLAIAMAAAAAIAAGALPPISATLRASDARRTAAQPPPARTDNLVALEMGGRTEGGRATGVDAGYLAEKALDGDPSTMYAAPNRTPLVLSFIGHDPALVSDVTITFASGPAKAPYGWPADYS